MKSVAGNPEVTLANPKKQIQERCRRRVTGGIVARIFLFVVQMEAIGSWTRSIKVYNRGNAVRIKAIDDGPAATAELVHHKTERPAAFREARATWERDIPAGTVA